MRRNKLAALSAAIGAGAAVVVAAWVIGSVLLELDAAIKSLMGALGGHA